jgi:hypothetical protein
MAVQLKLKYIWSVFFVCGIALLLASCAAERQGVVCDEIEYRLNTMTYSPDQRAFAEEELRVCREEEAQKKGEAAARRQSIYDRFASSDTSKKVDSTQVGDSASAGAHDASQDVSVSELMKDSSGEKTTSIYDRYGAMGGDTAKAVPLADSAATQTAQ